MSRRSAFLYLSAVALGACGGGPVSPRGLAYAVPNPSVVAYVTGDTTVLDIDAGGRRVQTRMSSAMTLGTSFERAVDGVQVTMTVQHLDARAATPVGAPVTVDEHAVDGPVVFTMDRRGAVTMVSEPAVVLAGQSFVQPLLLASSFFPRLPGRGVASGESWVDTISVEGPQGGGRVSSTTVVTYRAAGDTVVGGRTLLHITMSGDTDQSASGLLAGMDYSQSLKGTVSGWVLWDLRRRLMVERHANTDLRGSMEVSAAPFPLVVRVRGQNRITLNGGT